MVPPKSKAKRPGRLSHGRNPNLITRKPGAASLSAKATAAIIRTHHQLQKAHAQAVKAGDHAKAAEMARQIEEHGGLEKYQAASITGQSSERGGDSSRVLVEWLEELGLPPSGGQGAAPAETGNDGGAGLRQSHRLLEVGALSTTNACSRRRYLDVERIDLHSQQPGILQQDLMQRPLPTSHRERFDIISLSLVLNYVPDAVGRGEMLRRTCAFLRSPGPENHSAYPAGPPLPCLFLVLPAPCVTNSRYLDRRRLEQIMHSLGYALLKEKITAKLVYQLWRFDGAPTGKPPPFPKVEVNPGARRNNFCLVLK